MRAALMTTLALGMAVSAAAFAQSDPEDPMGTLSRPSATSPADDAAGDRVNGPEGVSAEEGADADARAMEGDGALYVVKKGDTLTTIAAEELGDPAQWRKIADLNRIDEPEKLEVGAQLRLPGAPSDATTPGSGESGSIFGR